MPHRRPHESPARPWRRGLVLGGASVAVLAGLAAGPVIAWHQLLPEGRSLPGTRLGEAAVQPTDVDLDPWLETVAARYAAEEAWVATDRDWVRYSRGELGYAVDVEATRQAVLEHARSGGWAGRLARALRARRGEERVDPVYRFEPERALAALERLRSTVHREPVDARLDLAAHRRIDDVPGAELDAGATATALAAADPAEDLPVFVAATTAIAPAVTRQMLADIDVSRVLASFETDFAGTGAGRAVNIARAAAYLDGTVLAPQQELSFNQQVGARSFERGFVLAPVIIDDELDTGVGGGVCQVASTLHAAAVFGGVEVLQRRGHSRPSAYAKPGLDATVIWGEVDLRIQNPYSTPLILHAHIPRPGVLRVEFLGRDPVARATYSYGVAKVSDFYRRVTTKPWLGERQVRRQKGRKGMDVVSLLELDRGDGRVVQRRWFSEYRPVPEVYWVGPAHDPSALPELPAGAVRLEVDGVEQPLPTPAAPAAGTSPSAGT